MNQPKDYEIKGVNLSMKQFDIYIEMKWHERKAYLEDIKVSCNDPIQKDIEEAIQGTLEDLDKVVVRGED